MCVDVCHLFNECSKSIKYAHDRVCGLKHGKVNDFVSLLMSVLTLVQEGEYRIE